MPAPPRVCDILAGSSTCCELYCTDTYNASATLCTLNSCSFTRGHKTHGAFRIIIFYVVPQGSTKQPRSRYLHHRTI